MPFYCCSSANFLLHCSPIQFSFAFFVHLLMLLFTSLYCSDPLGSNLFFHSSLLLSHRSRISAVTRGFFLTMFAKDLTGCLSQCCVEGGDHWTHVCFVTIHDGERCKLTAYHSLESFQHTGIFQPFEIRLESSVFWLPDSFRTKVEGHHQQVAVTLNVCFWKTSCSGTVHFWSEALLH